MYPVRKESSPYTWGVPNVPRTNIVSIRIIPIYMGSTNRLFSWLRDKGNHPHIHGEYQSSLLDVNSDLESSPYTWGVPGFKG